MRQEIITNSAKQTKKIGNKIARQILQRGPLDSAIVLALNGELGSGKTTFVQGFAEIPCIRKKVLSPTYVIMRRFEIPDYSVKKEPKTSKCFKNLYHIDCYRIKNPKEILDLGFADTIENPENIIIIEWAEKIKKVLPNSNIFYLDFKFLEKNKRKIHIPDILRIQVSPCG